MAAEPATHTLGRCGTCASRRPFLLPAAASCRTCTWKIILTRSSGAVAVFVKQPLPAPAAVCSANKRPWLFDGAATAAARGASAAAVARGAADSIRARVI